MDRFEAQREEKFIQFYLDLHSSMDRFEEVIGTITAISTFLFTFQYG